MQEEGDLVLTHPHGWHMGVNLGENIAEAVNMADSEHWPRLVAHRLPHFPSCTCSGQRESKDKRGRKKTVLPKSHVDTKIMDLAAKWFAKQKAEDIPAHWCPCHSEGAKGVCEGEPMNGAWY